MKPAEPFPRPSDQDAARSATSRRRTRRRTLWITVGAVVAIPVLALAWYFGVGYLNTLVATSGHGTHGVFTPGTETCHSTSSTHGQRTKSCSWDGVFVPEGDPDGAFDVTVSQSDGTRQEAWYVRLLPGTESAVVPATNSGRIEALIPLVVVVVFLVGSWRVALRPFVRRRKNARTPDTRSPDGAQHAAKTLDAPAAVTEPAATPGPTAVPPDDPSDSSDIPGLTRY